jgi:hypothetical protein
VCKELVAREEKAMGKNITWEEEEEASSCDNNAQLFLVSFLSF